ncbi:hypothetical protein [Halalkalibacter alkalisediminis]|nr:hypothetical protein [Halalkalibacter alkalisediminis]
MQEQIRSTDKTDFINVETFQAYKNEGQLLPPNTVAEVIIRLLTARNFPDGKVVNVGDYLK